MAYRSSSQLLISSTTTAAIPVPASAAIDDIAVCAIYKESTAAVTPPAGFTEKVFLSTSAATRGSLDVFWKRLTAADSGTYTFTWTGATFRSAVGALFSGRITSGDPWDGTPGTAEGTSGSTTLNVSTTGSASGGDGVGIWTNFNGGGSWTAPGGYTERQDLTEITIDTADALGSGPTGSISATYSISDFMKGFLGILLPAGAAAADPSPNPIWTPQFFVSVNLPAFIRSIARPVGPAALPYDIGIAGVVFTVDQTDSAGLTDATILDQTKEFTDSAGLTDARALTISTVLTDSTGLTDAATVELIKAISQTDDTGLTDAALLTQGKAFTDSAGLTDAAELTQSKVFTDSTGLIDTSVIQSGKTITPTDDTGLTDGQAFSQTHVLTDSTGLTDVAALTVAKVVTDSAGLADSATAGLQKAITATDSAGLTDGTILVRTAVLTDLVGLADAVALSRLLVLTDSAGLTDAAITGTGIPPTVNRPDGGVVNRSATALVDRPATTTVPRSSTNVPRPPGGTTPR